MAKDPETLPPPLPPLVAPVPENAEWTVTARDSAPTKGRTGRLPGSALTVIEVRSSKMGPVKRDVVTSGDGSSREIWFASQLRLWRTESGEVSVTDLSAAPPPDPTDPNPSVAAGFPGVAWITSDLYSGVEVVNGEACHHYANEGNEAWISAKTRLPVAYKCGSFWYVFRFQTPSASSLKMPQVFQNALEAATRFRRAPDGR